jgi:outer membrane murein-binding lipoprotein Lpp
MPLHLPGTTSEEAAANGPIDRRANRKRGAGFTPAAMIAGLMLACGSAPAQNAQPATPPQSPEEVNKRIDQLEKEVRELRKAKEAGQPAKPADQAAPAKPGAQPADDTKDRLDEQEKKVEDLTAKLNDLKPGTEKFLLSGFIATGLTVPQHGTSSFDAAFKPVFLWKISDSLLAAASVEFELADNATETNVEYMNINWDATDWLALRGGVILSPLNTFQQNLHPQWINKLPDNPLFAEDGGLAPEKSLGVEARGGVRTEIGKFTYSAWVSNGPSLITSGDGSGQLDLTEFTDVNNNKAVGGRLGYLPIPELELAYAVQFNDLSPSGSGLGTVNVVLHDVSVGYVAEQDWLAGRIDARLEFIFADFEKRIDLGSGPFTNDRTGGYAQLAYRPTKLSGILKDLEAVLRYDFLHQPNLAPTPADDQRWTIGLDYWVNPRAVVKIAYEFDNLNDPTGTGQSSNTFLLQAAVSF